MAYSRSRIGSSHWTHLRISPLTHIASCDTIFSGEPLPPCMWFSPFWARVLGRGRGPLALPTVLRFRVSAPLPPSRRLRRAPRGRPCPHPLGARSERGTPLPL